LEAGGPGDLDTAIYPRTLAHGVALELLEAKIAQFPRGSKFVLISSSDDDDQRRLEDQSEHSSKDME
jgi:hypothetical protein